MSDRISLKGLRVRGFHGVLAEEREDGQDFVVDVELIVDIREAAAADQLSKTVDYAVLARRLADVVGEIADALAVPCLLGVPVGHIDDQWTVPLGAEAELDADGRALVVVG